MIEIKSKIVKSALSVSLVSLIAINFTGCISATGALGIDTSNNVEQDAAFVKGDFKHSADLAYESKDLESDMDESNLLPTLKAGNSYLYAKDYNKSVSMLSEAEDIIKYQREQAMLGSAADYTAKLLLNDAAVDFQASMTASIMLNTYKSLAYMGEGKFSEARIELNRAMDRQRRAKEVYAKLISKQKEAIAEEKKKGKKVDSKKAKSIIGKHYSNLDSFKAYPDFVNPFTTYLAGLFFALEGDYSKSVDLLKEASSMAPDNKVIASDFKMVDGALSGEKIDKKQVWVIFENGLGPIKKEVRVDIPVYLVSKNVSYVGIALPKIRLRQQAYPFISVNSNDTTSKTEIVGEMDRVALTEFKFGYKYIITRAVLSATLKAYAQYQAGKAGGQYASLAMGLFSAFTTHADIRAWSTLPKDFQVTKVDMPTNGELDIAYGANHLTAKVDANAKNAIVYIRIPTAMSVPSVSVVNF